MAEPPDIAHLGPVELHARPDASLSLFTDVLGSTYGTPPVDARSSPR